MLNVFFIYRLIAAVGHRDQLHPLSHSAPKAAIFFLIFFLNATEITHLHHVMKSWVCLFLLFQQALELPLPWLLEAQTPGAAALAYFQPTQQLP